MKNAYFFFVIAHKDSFCFRFAESYVKVCKIKFFCFSLHNAMAGLHCRRRLTRIARQGMRVDIFTGKGRLRTLSSVVESRKFIVQEDAQRSVRVGCMIPFRCGDCHSVMGRHISRRGLTRVAYLCTRRCESPTVG